MSFGSISYSSSVVFTLGTLAVGLVSDTWFYITPGALEFSLFHHKHAWRIQCDHILFILFISVLFRALVLLLALLFPHNVTFGTRSVLSKLMMSSGKTHAQIILLPEQMLIWVRAEFTLGTVWVSELGPLSTASFRFSTTVCFSVTSF